MLKLEITTEIVLTDGSIMIYGTSKYFDKIQGSAPEYEVVFQRRYKERPIWLCKLGKLFGIKMNLIKEWVILLSVKRIT